jgi:hypothetical protein
MRDTDEKEDGMGDALGGIFGTLIGLARGDNDRRHVARVL